MLRDKYHLSEQRLANLKMSKVWAICKTNIKVHIYPRHISTGRNQVLAIALHNMGARLGCLKRGHL